MHSEPRDQIPAAERWLEALLFAVHKNLRKWLRWGRFRPNVARKAIGSSAPSGHSAQRDYAQGLRRPPAAAVTRRSSEGCLWSESDRALIATLAYSFARIRAALKMKVEDLRPRGAGWTVRLHENGGKQHAMPCHHALAEALRAYIDAAGIVEDRKSWLFRTARGHNGSVLSAQPMSQPDAWRMIRRRAAAAGIAEAIGCHTFRATGITAYLANGGAHVLREPFLRPVIELGRPRALMRGHFLRMLEVERIRL
jgi:integrase